MSDKIKDLVGVVVTTVILTLIQQKLNEDTVNELIDKRLGEGETKENNKEE